MGRFALGFALVLGVACRGELPTSSFDDSLEPQAGSAAEAPYATETATGGAAFDDVASVTASGGAADASDATDAEGCGAQPVTLAELHSGRVRPGVAVALAALRASSGKFLVSEAKSGSCLWGAFAADPSRTGAGSGVFLVSFGAPHRDGEACASGNDGLPDDLAPGDDVVVQGTLDAYAPAACSAVAPAQQLRVDAACPLRRTGRSTPPKPALIDDALATRLAQGKDAALLRDWGGALVTLESVDAQQDSDDGDAVFPFGVLHLERPPLEVHSRLYYFGLSDGGPRAPDKAFRYSYPTAFRSITGVVFLDYCTWALSPRDRCLDLAPPSQGCGAQAAGP